MHAKGEGINFCYLVMDTSSTLRAPCAAAAASIAARTGTAGNTTHYPVRNTSGFFTSTIGDISPYKPQIALPMTLTHWAPASEYYFPLQPFLNPYYDTNHPKPQPHQTMPLTLTPTGGLF